MRDPVAEFRRFNRPFAQRNPELMRAKIARMAEGPFAFFRGSFHLYASDVLSGAGGILALLGSTGTEMDLIGDIHAENFGTFKADDGRYHYDVNDFDETTTGRFDFDVCRLATSHFLAARERNDPLPRAVTITLAGVTAYADALRRWLGKNKPADLDLTDRSRTGSPAIDQLLAAAVAAKRPAFIEKQTEMVGKKRLLRRSAKYYNLPEAQREQALRLVADVRARQGGKQQDDFWAVEDVCGRVSGIGSMGRLRYAVLLVGKGSAAARNVLLEVKESMASAYDQARKRDKDAARTGRAERVIDVQRQSQAASPRLLGFAVDDGHSFQVRQLGASSKRLEAKDVRPGQFEGVARVQGELLARVHARAAARAIGPTNPLAELAEPETFASRVLAFALGYADQARRDWDQFKGTRADLDKVEAWMKG
jgi:uncharacterized protein (DUF2252 family)